MRSELLISVAQLPTIREDTEANSQCGANGTDMHTANGLEEYVKSIQTLAQPSSITHSEQQGQVKSLRHTRVRYRLSRGSEGKVLSASQDSTRCANILSLQMNTDPLAWLYRQSGKENLDCVEPSETSRVSLQSAIPISLYKASVSSSRRQLCIKDQGSEIQRPQEKRSRSQRISKKCRGRGPISRLQNPQLPVIYEL
ncbi:protein DEPP1 [Pelobates fuscus]|uniref:protein DEPP1 n=1 Tax=Pelobates fuscus TaxID=191477 RepID=UPI002FE442B9